MPSPFPGMDPFLERPDIFPDFHDGFITYLREYLQRELPEPYYAAIGRRAWIELSQRFIGPHVDILSPVGTRRFGRGADRGVAVADSVEIEPVVISVPHDEIVEPLVEIYLGRREDRRLVTSIELLSPANKAAGERGRELYLRKQREILLSKVHLVEIDLLRGGQHTTAVPRDRLQQVLPRFDYHACIHHFDNMEDYFVYPMCLTGPLVTIPIPLLPGVDPVKLDLQAVFLRTYDAGPYHREIDYRNDQPEPALSQEQTAWADSLVRRHETPS